MRCTDQLSNDHKLILRALDILKAMESRTSHAQAVDPADARAVLEFFSTFADRCHHTKEESILFPALSRAGMLSQGGPLGVMLFEHDQGRSLVDGMEDALGRRNSEDFAHFATRYIHLLTNHIYKEDHILFGMAEDVLTTEDDKRIMVEFEKVEQDLGEANHERFHRTIHEMELKYLEKAIEKTA